MMKSGLTHFRVGTPSTLSIKLHAVGADRQLQPTAVVRADSEDIRHGAEAVYDRSEFL